MLRHYWEALPIVYKFFIALVGGVGLLITLLLGYLWGYESKLMLQNEQLALHRQSLQMGEDLTLHLKQLQNEIDFLSRLEVMEDIVANDMDRRITRILEQKAQDLGESVILFTVNPGGVISAASHGGNINTHYAETLAMSDALKRGESYFYGKQNLYLFAPLYGSFYMNDFLGYIVMSYPLENFVFQLKADGSVHRWLTPPIGHSLKYTTTKPVYSSDEYLYDTLPLDGVLKGWKLHYAMPKKVALALLYHFQTVILSAFATALILISFLVWFIVQRLIHPLRELSDTAMSISLTGDYTKTVPENGNDEIGTLAHSFNALTYSTLISMKRLDIERKNHSDKLVSLIVFFNAITRSSTKEETIEIAMNEIRRFSEARSVYLDSFCSEGNGITISIGSANDVDSGCIRIMEPELKKEGNERFYEALERMIVLQIERIELLGKTQSALEAKSAFLSAMSHELRTPLGSILSLSQYLMTNPKTADTVLETLGKIENSAYHLLGVINTILDLAKAESGKMEPHISRCDPLALIEGALELVSPLADEKGLKIKREYERFEGVFMSDPRLFGQVVINLLSNAIKYTQDGSIEVVFHHHEDIFTLEIKDSGCGIAREALPYLFDEFYRVRRAESDGMDGSGLGLAISKRIALLLGGDLFVSSEGEGKGTTVSFHFRSC